MPVVLIAMVPFGYVLVGNCDKNRQTKDSNISLSKVTLTTNSATDQGPTTKSILLKTKTLISAMYTWHTHMAHLQLLRACEKWVSELTTTTQVLPTHSSGCGEGGQVTDVRREPNGSDALNGGSYVVFKSKSLKTKCRNHLPDDLGSCLTEKMAPASG